MTTITEPALEAGSDERLVQRIQADDLGAFEELYDRYSARAFGVARGICSNSHRAEDAVQEGFLAVWRSRGSFDPARGSVRAWLFTVIRHRSLDLARRTRRDDDRRQSGDALGSLLALDSVEQDTEAQAEATRVRSSLLKLPVAQREVILLAYFAGMTHTEIAARLELRAPRGDRQRPDAIRTEKTHRRVQHLQPTPSASNANSAGQPPIPGPQFRRGPVRSPRALSTPAGGLAGETPEEESPTDPVSARCIVTILMG